MGGEPDRDADLTATRLACTLRAGTRALAWITVEEDRAIEIAECAADELGWTAHTWSAATGVDRDGSPGPLRDLLTELLTRDEEALWIVLDGAAELSEPRTRRLLRELSQRSSGPAIVLVECEVGSALTSIPELTIASLPPPSGTTIAAHIVAMSAVLSDAAYPDARERLAPHAARIATAALGLPMWAVDRLLAEAVLTHGTDPDAVTAFVASAKPALLDRTGLLEVADAVAEDEVGGLHEYKLWLRRRALALRPDAAQAGIAPPRGVLLLGVQGCGKSLAARASAAILGLPLVRLEPGRLFGGTVGQSEANLRRVTALVERLAPIVLWLDEIDKGLAGVEGSAADAGTTARVVGSLLTWLQQRRRPVFVAATANRVDSLPPELLRRGRLDEIFFVDLPDAEQRAAILRVHLHTIPTRTLGAAPPLSGASEEFEGLARAAEGFSGAELEAALTEARLRAFAQSRALRPEDFDLALQATVPLSRTRAESVDALRQWARGRARLA